MSSHRHIVLVGPMGAGKTTIGKLLAADLGIPFRDSDQEIEARTGADISWIFDVEGENGFRIRETAVLQDLLQSDDPMVLATGGGIVTREENRSLLKQYGHVVYLSTSVDQQIERTAKDRKRPLLQTDDPAQVLKQLMSNREPLYQEVAQNAVETDKRNPKLVAQQIASLFHAAQ